MTIIMNTLGRNLISVIVLTGHVNYMYVSCMLFRVVIDFTLLGRVFYRPRLFLKPSDSTSNGILDI